MNFANLAEKNQHYLSQIERGNENKAHLLASDWIRSPLQGLEPEA